MTTIGFSLLSTGISSFASSSAYPTGAWQNLLVAGVFMVAMILSLALPKHVKMEDVGALTEDTIDKTGIIHSKTAGASQRTGCSCFACREVGFL